LSNVVQKIALEANSGRVKRILGGESEMRQAVRQVMERGWKDPWKVVTLRSVWAWFIQYGLMGLAFQSLDFGLANLMGVQPQPNGRQIFEQRMQDEDKLKPSSFQGTLLVMKGIMAPFLAGTVESMVANKAEVTRYLGPAEFKSLESRIHPANTSSLVARLYRAAGPAFLPNATRNFIMSGTSFVVTPTLFQLFPEHARTPQNLFLFGLLMNMGPGNGLAITMQSLWGRSLDAINTTPAQSPLSPVRINYKQVVSSAYQKHGVTAFFTPTRWFTRVLMNSPAQGTVPWFTNFVLPKGEATVLRIVTNVYTSIKGSAARSYLTPL
jgi:hypothetical protein